MPSKISASNIHVEPKLPLADVDAVALMIYQQLLALPLCTPFAVVRESGNAEGCGDSPRVNTKPEGQYKS
jgi:hypothetical protein